MGPALPEYEDLLALFGSEPEMLDEAVPWAYNSLTFTLSSGELLIRCEIAPSYGQISIGLAINGNPVAGTELHDFSSLEVELEPTRQSLIARREDAVGIALVLRPVVQLAMVAPGVHQTS